MAVDIAAGDTTSHIVYSQVNRRGGAAKGAMTVACRLTIDPNVDDNYPTGGILLTNMFTADAVGDIGMDPSKPIIGVCSPCRANDGVVLFIKAYFYNGGTTAAAQTLVLMNIIEGGSTIAIQEVALPNSDITAAALLGDDEMECDIVFYGTER